MFRGKDSLLVEVGFHQRTFLECVAGAVGAAAVVKALEDNVRYGLVGTLEDAIFSDFLQVAAAAHDVQR